MPGGTKTKLGLWLWLCMALGKGIRSRKPVGRNEGGDHGSLYMKISSCRGKMALHSFLWLQTGMGAQSRFHIHVCGKLSYKSIQHFKNASFLPKTVPLLYRVEMISKRRHSMPTMLIKSSIIAVIIVIKRAHTRNRKRKVDRLASIPKVLAHPRGNHIESRNGRVARPHFLVAGPGRMLP